jgi:uncharacterized membrane protein SpoIIM required for sporulation
VNQLFNQALRWLSRIGGWLFKKCWTEPAQVRGWAWTLAFWVFVLCFVALLQVIPHEYFALPWLILASGAVMNWQNRRPKKLGRELPYRRRR